MAARLRALLGIVVAMLAAPGIADAQLYVNVLHSFSGNDGATPYAPLVQATGGTFYGTTYGGGPVDAGTIFQMTPSGIVTVLHAFTGGTDGARPYASLIQGTDENFYGTTSGGGTSNKGTIFRMTPSGTVTVLHAFTGGSDGESPSAALIQAQDGDFYGTTELGGGGTSNGCSGRGIVFKMTPSGNLTVLHAFTAGDDGDLPSAALIQATDGNFYGTTYGGGSHTYGCFGSGTVFQMTPSGTVTIMHVFAGYTDGTYPHAALIQAADGYFYGTTTAGGPSCPSAPPCGSGVVFRMTPGGSETVLYAFAGDTDGGVPNAPLIQATDGNFYGTTMLGGGVDCYGCGQGTVFKVTPGGTFTAVHAFTGLDGNRPDSALIQATDGTLYGTASGDGFGGGGGVVFRLSPIPPSRLSFAADFDGDGKTGIAVYRPVTGEWYVLLSSTNSATYVSYQWGISSDVPVPADYDGDGKADIAVYRPSNGSWHILLSSTNYAMYVSYQWGVSADTPVPGDYDGDGKADIATYRPPSGSWYVLVSTTNSRAYVSYQWGASTDIPLARDYDGDGRVDIAVYRPATGEWYVPLSSTNFNTFIAYQFGVSTDVPVPADYDGDGKTDIAVYRPASGVWHILWSRTSSATPVAYQWGVSTDTPVPADYDGDGKADIAVYRPASGDWYVLLSKTNYTSYLRYHWGVSMDIP